MLLGDTNSTAFLGLKSGLGVFVSRNSLVDAGLISACDEEEDC